MEIFKSASKLVFVIMTVATVAGMFLGIIDPKDFIILASMTFSFYFSNKGDSTKDYLGK